MEVIKLKKANEKYRNIFKPISFIKVQSVATLTIKEYKCELHLKSVDQDGIL